MADAAWVEAVDAAPDAARRVHAVEALDAHWQQHGVHDADVGAISLQHHLHSATPAVALAACAALETLVAAAHTTRTTLTLVRTVAPAALERTGDAHERVRAHAEQLLAHIADAAYAASDHGVREIDAPHTVWERLVRDVALTAPAPRIRITVLRLLPALKARHARMHVHPLLPSLVDNVQASDAGVRAAHLVNGRMLDFIEFDDDFAIVKMRPPRETQGYTLAESDIRARYGVTVVGVKSPGKDFTYAVPETVVAAHDLLIVSGRTGQIEKFSQRA